MKRKQAIEQALDLIVAEAKFLITAIQMDDPKLQLLIRADDMKIRAETALALPIDAAERDAMDDFPKLNVTTNGGSSLEINAILPESYFCGEFTTKKDYPQPILYAPWIQFEPVKLADIRQKLAYEIVRRVELHDTLIETIDKLEKRLESQQSVEDRLRETQRATYDMWGIEREKYGLKKDFSDVPQSEWRKELMSGYEYEWMRE